MIYKIIFSVIFFIWFLRFNYKGALGRIEGLNQKTGMPQDLGPVKPHEQKALENGTHKKLAFQQAFISSLIMTSLIFGVLSLVL